MAIRICLERVRVAFVPEVAGPSRTLAPGPRYKFGLPSLAQHPINSRLRFADPLVNLKCPRGSVKPIELFGSLQALDA